jgi:hypothetical protein
LLCLNVIESEWKALSRCRRVWAAMALGVILKGQSALTEISGTFECEVGELEDLKRSAKVRMRVRIKVRDMVVVRDRVRAWQLMLCLFRIINYVYDINFIAF